MPAETQPATRLPISVSIVCKDSARTLGEVLQSVSPWASQIIAVDSGSTDSTLDLLGAHNATIIQHEWLGHVKTKQLALSHCTQPWVLCLDADESVDETLAASIRQVVSADDSSNPGIVAARVNRKIWYRGRFLNHAWQPEWRLRLVRNGSAAWTGLDPHDKLEVTTTGAAWRTIDLPGTLKHDSFVTFADQLAKDTGYAKLMAANLHASGARTSRSRCVTSPIGAFAKQMLFKQAWRDGVPGWLAALSTASATLQKHCMLLELQHLERTQAQQPRR